MRILLIGSRNVGKTTHMATCYGMMKKGVTLGRFRFFGNQMSFANNSELDWMAHACAVGNLPATAKLGSFSTTLLWRNHGAMRVTFSDSRGQMLAMPQASREFRELRSAFMNSDCIMAYFRSEDIVSQDTFVKQIRTDSLANLVDLMNERLRSGKRCVVIINITCCDLVSNQKALRAFITGFLKCDSGSMLVAGNLMTCVPGRERNVLEPLALCLYHGLCQPPPFDAGVAEVRNRQKCRDALRRYLEGKDMMTSQTRRETVERRGIRDMLEGLIDRIHG